MTYARLIADHDAIEIAAKAVLSFTQLATPKPQETADALRTLRVLAVLVRDHLAHEDPIIYACVDASRNGQHAATAATSAASLDRLKDDWSAYLYRWNARAVRDDWKGFAAESNTILHRLRERIEGETMILYSLALHHGVMTPDE